MKFNKTQTTQPIQTVEQKTETYPSWVEDAIKETPVDLSKDVNFNKNDVLAIKKIIFAIFSGIDVKITKEIKNNFMIVTFYNETGSKIASYTLPLPKK